MALQGCYSCIKYLMFAFNLLFWLLGCAILGIGIWIKVDPGSFSQAAKDTDLQEFFKDLGYSDHIDKAGYGAIALIVIGSIIMVIGFLGCCGAIRESQCMLVLFFVFLFIIFAVLLAIGIYIIITKDKLKESITETLEKTIKEAKEGSQVKQDSMRSIQKRFECCGAALGRADYGAQLDTYGCEVVNWGQPCSPKLYDALSHNFVIIAGVAVGIGAVMFLGMLFSMLLCCAIKENMA